MTTTPANTDRPPDPGRVRRQHGVVDLSDSVAARLRWGALATCLVAIGVLGLLGILGWLPRNPDGDWFAPIEAPAQFALLATTLLGVVLALRWPAVAAAIIALSGVGLSVLAAVSYRPLVAVAVAMAFVLPSVALWMAWQRHESPARIAALALVTSGLLLGSWYAADATYDHFFGPAHPVSDTPAVDDPVIVWAWSGAVTPDGFDVVARVVDDVDRVGLHVRSEDGVVDVGPVEVDDGVARFSVDGLAARTTYDYEFTVDGTPTGVWAGSAATFDDRRVDSVTIAVASCARTGSNGVVYDALRAEQPDLYVITGDFHYSNIDRNDTAAFDRAYERTLTAPSQAALYRSVPVAYVWDDHDYSGNDGDSTAASQPAARESYERNVAHHQLVSDRTINQAFSVDGVRIVLVDTRSARVPGETLLGAEQLAWLEDELLVSSPTHDLVVLVTPTPWIGAASENSDAWAGFAAERAQLARFVAANDLDNLMIVGGDAHMVAIDDGTNSDYSGTGGAAMPVLQAAALDRPGSVKGGPYSHGTFPGAGQFGLIQVDRRADGEVVVTLEGRRYDGEHLATYTFSPG